MRRAAFLMLFLAIVLGAGAVYMARDWLQGQMAQQQTVVVQEQAAAPVETTTVVVARRGFTFGDVIDRDSLREVTWPQDAAIPGSFSTIDEIYADEPRRVALRLIEPNEPITENKISGGDRRATLSTLVSEGMRAVTIRVNDVLGVAGFVLPGDRVDILLTRSGRDGEGGTVTDVLLQNMRVLGIDQDANDAREQPAVVRAVTLEATTDQAQKLTLAASVGTMSLALRNQAYVEHEEVQTIRVSDLLPQLEPPPAMPVVAQPAPQPPTVRPPRQASINVVRGLSRSVQTVMPEGVRRSVSVAETPPAGNAADASEEQPTELTPEGEPVGN